MNNIVALDVISLLCCTVLEIGFTSKSLFSCFYIVICYVESVNDYLFDIFAVVIEASNVSEYNTSLSAKPTLILGSAVSEKTSRVTVLPPGIVNVNKPHHHNIVLNFLCSIRGHIHSHHETTPFQCHYHI